MAVDAVVGPKTRRWVPVVTLLLLSPFVAELLLGDVAITSVFIFVIFIPLYGCGALLIREVVRRTGRGWPSIALLAFAFGVIEEGYVTMSLFNPDYAGYRLLDEAPLHVLGMGGKWTVFVLSLHVIWSICAPIAVAESLFPARARAPWLRIRGMIVAGVVFVLGCALLSVGALNTEPKFRPTVAQMVVTGVVAVVFVGAALAARSGGARRSGTVPPVLVIFGAALLAASVVVRSGHWLNGWVGAAVILVTEALAVAALWVFGRRAEWGLPETLATASGAFVAYGWSSFLGTPIVGSTDQVIARVGNVVYCLVALVVLLIAWRRVRAWAANPDRDSIGVA
ncbi:hypothetical protein OG203_37450 [Nocardia sp. NBC_01499]|uniref:hypothetical protein n=1 Tax=Nocardia sp. NBC_01499 TaxID=2903597 RepID=UPI0038637750